MAAAHHYWTKRDDAYLLKHYSKDMKISDIGDHLGITHSQVVHRAISQGLQRKSIATWTVEQEDCLTKYYGKVLVEELALMTTHSYAACCSRARDLGLQQKRRIYTAADKRKVKSMLKKDHTKYEIAIAIKCTYGSVNHLIRKMKKDGLL